MRSPESFACRADLGPRTRTSGGWIGALGGERAPRSPQCCVAVAVGSSGVVSKRGVRHDRRETDRCSKQALLEAVPPRAATRLHACAGEYGSQHASTSADASVGRARAFATVSEPVWDRAAALEHPKVQGIDRPSRWELCGAQSVGRGWFFRFSPCADDAAGPAGCRREGGGREVGVRVAGARSAVAVARCSGITRVPSLRGVCRDPRRLRVALAPAPRLR